MAYDPPSTIDLVDFSKPAWIVTAVVQDNDPGG